MEGMAVSDADQDTVYIGDGVYASHDGYNIWLKTQRYAGWHEIALEPSVFAALLKYRLRLAEKYATPIDRAVDEGPGHELD